LFHYFAYKCYILFFTLETGQSFSSPILPTGSTDENRNLSSIVWASTREGWMGNIFLKEHQHALSADAAWVEQV
tara:strand:- start:1202 stop:1423 length:222 start_codon:yes stop_codon:yes gene_type:complete